MTERQLIVVDLETTGLDPQRHTVLEVAAVNVDTGESLYFAPYVTREQLMDADPDALRINRYFERGVYQDALKCHNSNLPRYRELWNMLRGNTLGGANPRFDAAMLVRAANMTEVWHYRLADVSAYVAGATGLHGAAIEGLQGCCERLGVVNDQPHSALGDAEATAKCFRLAMEGAGSGVKRCPDCASWARDVCCFAVKQEGK